MAVYLGSDKVGITKELGSDRLQWKCDNVKNLQYEFATYAGTSEALNGILKGLDTSEVTNMSYMFQNNENLTDLDVSEFNTANVTNMSSMFSGCEKLTELDVSNFNTSKVTNIGNLFAFCYALTSLNVSGWDTSKVTTIQSGFATCRELVTLDLSSWDTSKVTTISSLFSNCNKLEDIIGTLNVYAISSSIGAIFTNCYALKNVTLKNIRGNITLGSGTTYGTNITLDTLVNTIKELWDYSATSTTKTLTLSTASKSLIANVYVKLVTPTAEEIAQDQYINNKKPCVVCESTDEGAMTITEYATSKKWTIA